MTTRQTSFLSEIANDNEIIPVGKLSYLRERTRARIYDYVLSKFLEREKTHGLTKTKLARRIRHDPAVINRWFASPKNWTIDTISDLLVGIGAEELEPGATSLLGRAPRNQTQPDWFKPIDASQGALTNILLGASAGNNQASGQANSAA